MLHKNDINLLQQMNLVLQILEMRCV